jgi:hypothetical protein
MKQRAMSSRNKRLQLLTVGRIFIATGIPFAFRIRTYDTVSAAYSQLIGERQIEK